MVQTKNREFSQTLDGQYRAIGLHLVDILLKARLFTNFGGVIRIGLRLVDLEKRTRLFTNFGRVMEQQVYIWYTFSHTHRNISCKTMEFYRDSTWNSDGHSCKTTEVQRGNSLKYGICLRHEKNQNHIFDKYYKVVGKISNYQIY